MGRRIAVGTVKAEGDRPGSLEFRDLHQVLLRQPLTKGTQLSNVFDLISVMV